MLLERGCPTGPSHTEMELHGFLSYLVKVNLEGQKIQNLWLQGQAGQEQYSFVGRGSFHCEVYKILVVAKCIISEAVELTHAP